jgi:predicted  nucleic acid-binding Zn-ribbon protein
LSPAQFAELLTTLNVGGGVPGTLQSFDGKQIEQLEVTESESKRVREHYEKMLKVKRAEVKEEIKAIEAEMDEKKTLTIDLKKRIKAVLESLTVQSEGSMPFYIDQFQEATERVVVQAKAEVDAFVTHAIQQTGLEQLRAQAPRIEASVHDDGKIPYEKS